MKAVAVKTLKNKLSELARLAESGETVLVADRDRVAPRMACLMHSHNAYSYA